MKLKHIAILAIAATLVIFSRLDLVFLTGLFGLWIVFREQPLRYLLPLDIALLALSVVGSFIFRIGLPDYYLYTQAAMLTLGLSLGLKIPVFYFLGLYNHPKTFSLSRLIRQSAIGIVLCDIAILAIILGLASLGVIEGRRVRRWEVGKLKS